MTPSERVLWTGSPVRFPLLDPADLLRVPFIVVWLAFGIFWEIGVSSAGGGHRYPPFFKFYGVLILVLGVCGLVGKLFADRVRLRHTHYTLTDRRIIVSWTMLGNVRENTRLLSDIAAPMLTDSGDGIGTIRFGRNGVMFMATGHRRDGKIPITFREIENARLVLELVERARTNYTG